MDSLAFNDFNMEIGKPIFTTASETQPTSNASFSHISCTLSSAQSSGFSPMAPPFQSRTSNELLSLISQQEARQADTAPTTEIDDLFMNLRINGSDSLFDDTEQASAQNYFMGNRSETVTPSHSDIWNTTSDTSGPSVSASRNVEMIDTFDFLAKSKSSANNYESMLPREQLHVLRSIRPSVRYDFLQDVAKVRSEKRMRRALSSECAFCKNNGENEEFYSSHALKNWRGRVLRPVLRAFCCPRCGATGDRAHIIKYCTQNVDGERAGGLSSRRRMSAASLVTSGRTVVPPTLAPAPSPSLTPSANLSPSPSTGSTLPHASSLAWSSFSMNEIDRMNE